MKKTVSLILIITLCLLLISGISYFKLKKELIRIKEEIIQQAETELGLQLSIKEISPFFFRGIQLIDLAVYKDKDEIVKIENVRIKIRLKDILFKKVKIEKSIYKIDINNYIIHLSEKQIEQLKELIKREDKEPIAHNIEHIRLNGKIYYESVKNRLKITLINPKTIISIPSDEIEFNADVFLESILVKGFSLKVEGFGRWGDKTNSLDIALNNFRYKSKVFKKKVYLNCNLFNNKIQVFAQDENKQFYTDGVVSGHNFDFKGEFKDFIIEEHKINGRYSIANDELNTDLKVFARLKRYLIKIHKESKKTIIDNISISSAEKSLLNATGWFKNLNSFLLHLKLNGYNFKEHKLTGYAKIFPADKKSGFVLKDFFINKYRIQKLYGEFYYKEDKVFVDIVENTENFYLNSIFGKGTSDLNINLNKIQFSTIKKILKKDIPALLEKNIVSGTINTKIRNNKIVKFISSMEIILKSVPNIKKVYINSEYRNRQGEFNIKAVFNDDNIVLLKANSFVQNDIINVDTLLKTPSTSFKARGTILDEKGRYRINYYINNFLRLNGIIYKDGNINIIANLNKKTENRYLTSIRSYLKIKGDLEDIKNLNINGDVNITGKDRNDSVAFVINTKDKNIVFDDIEIKYKNKNLYGQGFYNIETKNIYVNLNKIKISGNLSLNETTLYIVFKNIQNIQLSPSIKLSLNGLIKYQTDFISKKYIYSNLNFYKITIGEFNIDEVYLIYRIKNNKLEVEKFSSELYQGKIRAEDILMYERDGLFYISSVLRIFPIKYKNLKINGKLYTKLKIGKTIEAKLKIIKIFINDFKIKNISQKFYLKDNKLYMQKLTDTGIKGVTEFADDFTEYNVKFFIEDKYLALLEGKTTKDTLNLHFNLKDFNLEFVEYISDIVKHIDGTINSDIKIVGRKDDPDISGIIQGEDIKLKCRSIIKKADSIVFDISANKGQISVNKFRGRIGKGWFKSYGIIDIEKKGLGEWNLFFETIGKEGLYISRAENDLMGEIKGKVKITGTLDELDIAGKVLIQNFDFTWPLESDESSKFPTPVKKINLNVYIVAGKNVIFYQNQNNIDILVKEGGKFHIRGDMSAEHKVVGIMEAEKGSLEYFGTPFDIKYATVSFADAYEENVPLINAKAEAVVKGENDEEVTITMLVDGRAYNDLTPVLLSSPALTKKEIFYLLNDSTLYITSKSDSNGEIIEQSEKDIEELIKIGFVQIFDTTYRNKLVAPFERSAKRFLGLDILKIKSSLVKNLLSPQIINLQEQQSEKYSILAGTEVTVGKYLTDRILFKYSIALQQSDTEFNRLYYEHQFGIEMNILQSLKFEWKYKPLYMYYTTDPGAQQEYILKWKKKISF